VQVKGEYSQTGCRHFFTNPTIPELPAISFLHSQRISCGCAACSPEKLQERTAPSKDAFQQKSLLITSSSNKYATEKHGKSPVGHPKYHHKLRVHSEADSHNMAGIE
jgi:hypothetical protein